MKRFNDNLRKIFAVLLIILTTSASLRALPLTEASTEAIADISSDEWLDSVDISLLTCGPGHEVWSLYGHTALRIEDKVHGTDFAVNWGLFSFQQSGFVVRFVFGLTDYTMGIYPTQVFLSEYESEGRWVRQQRIRLSRTEKMKIMQEVNNLNNQEDWTYRYNYFYDNCTTRARDMLLDNIGLKNVSLPQGSPKSTYRREIHKLNEHDRWARFGNDLLLGYQSDRSISRKHWEFLPDNLSKDFDITKRRDFVLANPYKAKAKGEVALVDSSFYLIAPEAVSEPQTKGITPSMVFLALGAVILAASLFELKKRKNLWWIDATLQLATGLAGLILLAMVFSLHPTVRTNFQILLLCPLNLLFLWPVVKGLRHGKISTCFHIEAALLLLFLLLQFWQSYAEGMMILALTLLIRYIFKNIQAHQHVKET